MTNRSLLLLLTGTLLCLTVACSRADGEENNDANTSISAEDMTSGEEDMFARQDMSPEEDMSEANEDMTTAADMSPEEDMGPGDPDFTPPSEPGRHVVELVETIQVIPGDGLPAEAMAQNSNNNLDVVWHDGRVYLAWRTGPDHFASEEARIHVVSSEDQRTWRWEASFARATDLREPRFLSHGGELFLYLAELGTDPRKFEPQGMLYTKLGGDGAWSELTDFYEPGYIPWRSKVIAGTPYMMAYVGGEHIYDWSGEPVDIELLTTTDGVAWQGVDPQDPVVSTGGGSETDFVLTDDGDLLAVIRNEAGDETGFGSKVCRAPASDITDWTCEWDPRKYDSPLMFWHDGEAYLVGRRHLTPTGHYDLELRDWTLARQLAKYQLEYVTERKRCSIWRYEQSRDEIVFIMDLPSRGDTCFPSIIEGDAPGEFWIYNYSTPIDGEEDPAWNVGQKGETRIYRHRVRFTPREQ